MNSPLAFHAVTKTFDSRPALHAIELELPAGHVIGLLGRNGAGKTTLFNIACGLVVPASGSCLTLGVEAHRLSEPQLERLGVVHQGASFPPQMTVRELFDFTASFYPKWDKTRERQLTRELELPEDRIANLLSPGDEQKAALICAVCHHPELLLLDEPVSALDPIARARMLEFLLSLAREDDATVMVSSHLLTDVEKIIDWVVCLDSGELAVNASLDDVLERHGAEAGRPLNLEQLFPRLIEERPSIA